MPGKFLSPEASLKLIELARRPYRPKEIIALRENIGAKTRLAEFRESAEGIIDKNLVSEIVAMKLHLDKLYCDWAQGKIS